MGSSVLLTVTGFLVSALLITAVVVGTWAGLRTGKTGQTLKNFRDAAASWEAKSTGQDAEITQLKSQLSEAMARLTAQDAKISVMQELVTGTKAIELLTGQMTAIRREVLEEHRLTRELIKEMAQAQA